MSFLKTIVIGLAIGYGHLSLCQTTTENNLKILDSLLAEKEYIIAKAFTKKHIDSLIALNEFYQLADYIYYYGQIEAKINGRNQAIKSISTFENLIKSLTANPKALRQTCLEIGAFYESIGDSKTAKDYNLKALDYTKKMPEATAKDVALIQSNLGVFYMRLGDMPLATNYHKQALKSLESDDTSSGKSYYITYNALGGMMWYASKFDSAIVYYKKAEKILHSLEPNPMNTYYRPASLNNNVAGIYSIQGKQDDALTAMRQTVNYLSAYLKEEISDARRTDAREFLFQAIDNYAGLYKEMGHYKKAKQLINYAYLQKQQYLGAKSPEISKGKVLLGQINIPLKNFKEAEQLLDEGISDFLSFNGGYSDWLANAYYYKAQIHFETNKIDSAKQFFELSEAYFKASLGDYYDEVFLNFSVSASSFYAQIGNHTKAIGMATDALEYIRKNQGNKTLLEYYQLLNLAHIYNILGDEEQVLQYCEKALNLLDSDDFIRTNKLNKLQIESNKIPAIILKVKSQLKRKKTHDEQFLAAQLKNLQTAIKLLDEQKSMITDEGTVALLIQDNLEVFKLAKQLSLDLYHITKNDKYLYELLGYHESITYHKIRSRLNSKSTALSANVPEHILVEEQRLKAQLNQFSVDNSNFELYVDYENEWNIFLNTLKTEYPNYYSLKYATIHQSLEDISSKIPGTVTIIRYVYLDEKLYALVITSSGIDLVTIDATNLSETITTLNKSIADLETTFQLQHALYQRLWKPLESKIKTSKITIIPDKELFNLSFETLTPKKANVHRDILNNSLLSSHTLSYNYSLFLIDKHSKPVNYNSNFIAFAPAFTDSMKTSYKIAIKDSLNLDRTYLRLLPQPFATELAKNYSKLFNGDAFINENASKQLFANNAKEHKIIHIGTHAESDNISPELSRLIFAKNTDEEDNSLYTFEIYNQNLSSNLAILTACETGKPTFQPGEGMISLAHAFNYAGSESILTSLWNIDEQSSAEITKHFYNYLSDGLDKDKALKQAKLKYLSTAKGRTAAPQYWAGLVLIGDTSPIDFQTSVPFIYWIIGLLLAIIIMTWLSKKLTRRF